MLKKTKRIEINILHRTVAFFFSYLWGVFRLFWPRAKALVFAHKKDAGLGRGGRGESEIAQPCI
jgi:hypothetical protein